ncbi:tetratricopeptide repeat protein [Kitasatospora sp. NPDC088548]|uniref:tetratricopeptide repeat protein n=1 Tax=Kitasatospora sp. NPDC088548 TaxID=3364075 RepID=UPI00382236F9
MTTSNNVSGGHASGTIVQAHTVCGGITVHTTLPPPPVPRQLPRGRILADRVEDTDRLLALLDQYDPPPVLITGTGGIGKTALALNVLHTIDLPGGHLYADLGAHTPTGPTHPADVTARWLRALGIDTVPPDPHEARALLLTLTAQRPVGVLLDDAASAEQVLPLLPANRSKVIVTARGPLLGLLADGAHPHHLGPLPDDDALALLAAIAGRPAGPRLDDLVERCRGVPVVLVLAGARLAAGHDTLPAPPLPGTTALEATVDNALDQTYRDLDPQAARLYRVLGLLPLPGTQIDPAMAAAAAALDPVTTGRLLDALTEARLITAPDGDPLSVDAKFHFTTADGRRHAARLAHTTDDDTTSTEVRRRALDWLTAETATAARLLDPYRRHLAPQTDYLPSHRAALTTPGQALAWLAARGPGLRTALETARDHQLDATAAHLVHAAWPWLLRERNYQLWLWAHDIAIDAARRLAATAPRPGCGRQLLRELLGARANALRAVGRHPDAIADCREAIASAIEDHDDIGHAQHLHGLGAAHHDAGEPDLALPPLRQSLRLRREFGRRRDAGVTQLQLAIVVADLGDRESALAGLRTAHADLSAEQDGLNSARALAWTGRLLTQAGRHDGARTALTDALTAFRHQGARLWQARVLHWLGLLAEDERRVPEAIALQRQALALYAGSPADRARVEAVLERLDPADPVIGQECR